MSTQITKAVYDHAPLDNPLHLSVAAALAFYANDEGVAWPLIESLAKRCRAGEKTVRRALKAIEAAGMIEVQKRYGRSSTYRFLPVDNWQPVTATAVRVTGDAVRETAPKRSERPTERQGQTSERRPRAHAPESNPKVNRERREDPIEIGRIIEAARKGAFGR